MAKSDQEGIYHFGATYERTYETEDLDLEVAKEVLLPRLVNFGMQDADVTIEGCKAGIRVCRRGGYLPCIEKISERIYAITAMGSRGLLYHAYFGKQLAEEIL